MYRTTTLMMKICLLVCKNMQVPINPTLRYAVSDLLKDWNLDLTRRSLRFFGLLQATTEGLGKQPLIMGSSSIITMDEIEGNAGWQVIVNIVSIVFVLINFLRASFLSISFALSKASCIFQGCNFLKVDLVSIPLVSC